MYEELKQRIIQIVEANRTVKANPSVVLAHIVKAIFADESLSNEKLISLCGITRNTFYNNLADFKALNEQSKSFGLNDCGSTNALAQKAWTKTLGPTKENEKTENENLPDTPLKEEKKEEEKSIPPTPQGGGQTDGKPDFVTSGADLVNCEANRCERAPRRQKVVLPADDNDTTPSEDNAMPDHEHYLAFIKAYPPQKAYSFRVKYINKFNKAWRDAIARGYKGKDLVAALEMAKESKKWKETYCDYAPNAIDFLEQNFAALYYPSCKPSKTAAATTVIRADIDI